MVIPGHYHIIDYSTWDYSFKFRARFMASFKFREPFPSPVLLDRVGP